MIDLDSNTLATVVEAAKRNASNDPRWVRAIEKAAIEIEQNPYIAMVDGDLIIASETSGGVYQVNGHCDCMAGMHGKPCKHRALKRILQRYNEAEARKAAAAKAKQEMSELFG